MLLISIIAFGLLLCLLTKAKLPRPLAWLVCAGVFLGLVSYLVIALSWGLGAEAFDESVIYHVVSGYGGVPKGILIPVLSVAAIALAAAGALCVWVYAKTRRHQHPARLALPVCALSTLAFFTNPVVADLASSGYFRLTESSAQPPEYQTPADVSFAQRPNIVYIYLESLERTFLNGKVFPGLAPHLKQLESEAISFTNIQQTYGTGWTMAGMVASQCGIPLSADIWNSMSGLDQFLPGATCLGDLLSAQGYTLDYLGGADSAFAGKGSFYRSHHFNRVQGQAELTGLLRDPAYQNNWGLYDDSLFDIFKQRFDELAAVKRPFGLFTLTNSTHPPDGNLPRTCPVRYGGGTDGILDAVQCTDFYVAEIVNHIRRSSAGRNTIIVIGSDHLAMRSKTTDQWLARQQRRDLLLILAPGSAPARIDKPGTTLDVAATLLGLISNVHRLGFGTDLRGSRETLLQSKLDLHRFLMSKVPFLNTLWEFPSLQGGMTIDPVNAELSIQSHSVRLPVLFLVNRDLSIKDVVFPGRNDFQGLSGYVARLPQAQRFLWVDHCGELSWLGASGPDWSQPGFCMAYGTLNGAYLPVTRLGQGMYRFSKADAVDALQNGNGKRTFYEDRASVLETIKRYGTANLIRFQGSTPARGYAVVAAAGAERSSYVEYKGQKKYLEPGITLVDFPANASEPRLQHLGSCAAASVGKNTDTGPVPALRAADGEQGTWVIVKTSTAPCDGAVLNAAPIAGAKMVLWPSLTAKEAYIGIVSANRPVAEYAIPPGTALAAQAVPATNHDNTPG